MKLPTEVRGAVDNDDKSSLKVGSKALTTMGVKRETMGKLRDTKHVCVDEIVSGIRSCTIRGESPLPSELSNKLENLKLEERGSDKKSPRPVERKAQPKEDDERGDISPGTGSNMEDSRMPDNFVKLEAPGFADSEEDEENCEDSNEGAELVLEERGPMLGVPANYNMEPGHNYIASKPCMPYQLHGENYDFVMPSNFPDYSFQNAAAAQGKGPKRGMDDRLVHHEPQKYVRPQDVGSVEINNLNAPGSMPPPGAVNVNVKPISHVYQKQMSGGTVYSSNDMIHTDQLGNSFDHPNSLDFQDLLELGYAGQPGSSLLLETEDFLPSGPSSLQALGIEDQGVMPAINQVNVGLHQQQWGNQQEPLPPVSTLTNLLHHKYQQQKFDNYYQQPGQTYQDVACRKRGSFGNDDYSDGYASDFSPSHEMQSSPMPSPHSVMDASPATYSGSPPRTNWSPPPSNMSHCSVDSGVSSPMSEDHMAYYSSQKSPRQNHVSPKSSATLPGTPHQNGVISSSPPLQNMPPAQVKPPSRMPIQQIVPRVSEGEEYVCHFIDNHLIELNEALAVAHKDLITDNMRKISYHQTSYNPEAPGGTMRKNMLNDDLVIISGTSKINLQGIPYGIASMPPQNIPVTVSPVIDSQNPANNHVITNPTIPVTSQVVFSLPTTVPTTISTVDKKIAAGLPTKSRVTQPFEKTNTSYTGPLPQPLPQRALIVKPGPPIASVPQVTPSGKIAIPPIHPRPKPTQIPNQVGSLFVATGEVMTTDGGIVAPLFRAYHNDPSQPPKRTLRPLAPKGPTGQKGETTEVNVKPTTVGNTQPKNSSSNSPAQNGKKTAGPSVERLLNLARRLVAEMSTSDLKYKDEDGDTYLHVAVCKADRCMVQALLERLVREHLLEMIDMQNSMGQTPLYLAASTNHAEMVQLLIEHGADVNPFAESMTSTGVVEKLAAIHCVSTKGGEYLETLKALLKAPVISLNQVNSDGHTALICAILAHGKMKPDLTQMNSVPIIQALMNAGADPNLQIQQSGKTALMYALESRDLDLIENIFQLVEPQKLPVFLKTQAFDGSSCLKIAELLKVTLDQAGQQRLWNSLKSSNSRGMYGTSAT